MFSELPCDEQHHITSRHTNDDQLHGVYNKTRFVFHQFFPQIHIFISLSKRWNLFPGGGGGGGRGRGTYQQKYFTDNDAHKQNECQGQKIFPIVWNCKVNCLQIAVECFQLSYSDRQFGHTLLRENMY